MRMQVISSVKKHILPSRLLELKNSGLSSNETFNTILREACARGGIPMNFSQAEIDALRTWTNKQI